MSVSERCRLTEVSIRRELTVFLNGMRGSCGFKVNFRENTDQYFVFVMTAGPTGQFGLLVSAPRSKKGYFAIVLIVEEAPYSQPLSVSLFQCLCYLGNITF